MNILVITEQRDGKWNQASFETLAAAQQIAAANAEAASPPWSSAKACARSPTNWRPTSSSEVLLVEHDLLDRTRPTASPSRLRQAIAQAKPDLVLLPHTYQVRDFAPKLAASLGKGMIGDCIGYRHENGRLIFVRQMFQGKTAADVIVRRRAALVRVVSGRRVSRRSGRARRGSRAGHDGRRRFEAGADSHQAARTFPRSQASRGPHASAHPGGRRPRHQGARKYSPGRKTGQAPGRRTGGVAPHLR